MDCDETGSTEDEEKDATIEDVRRVVKICAVRADALAPTSERTLVVTVV